MFYNIMICTLQFVILLKKVSSYNCDFSNPQQYPIFIGGLTSGTSTSVLTFVIETSTNSILIGGTSTSTDLTL